MRVREPDRHYSSPGSSAPAASRCPWPSPPRPARRAAAPPRRERRPASSGTWSAGASSGTRRTPRAGRRERSGPAPWPPTPCAPRRCARRRDPSRAPSARRRAPSLLPALRAPRAACTRWPDRRTRGYPPREPHADLAAAGSTRAVQPCGTRVERPGIRRASRPLQRTSSPWTISTWGARRKSWARRAKRPRGGAPAAPLRAARRRCRRTHVRRDPTERRLAHDRHPLPRPLAVLEVPSDTGRRVTPAQRGHVRLLGAVQEVARREDARPGAAQRGIHGRATRGRVELQAGHHGQLVIGDPVGGEDDGVALDGSRPTGVEIGQLDLLDARAPVDRGHLRAGPERHPVPQARPRRNAASDACRRSSVVSATVSAPPWASVRIAEKLTCSAPTTSARRPAGSPRR